MHLKLGSQRLWRECGMGRSSDMDDVEEKEVYKVFVTYSTQVAKLLKEGIIKIQLDEDEDDDDDEEEEEEVPKVKKSRREASLKTTQGKGRGCVRRFTYGNYVWENTHVDSDSDSDVDVDVPKGWGTLGAKKRKK
jgi:hypothetical protein